MPASSGGGFEGPSRGFFDAWAYVYDFPLVQLATYWPVHAAVLRVLRTVAPRRVLDIGCGTGQLATRIAAEIPRTRVTGCDFSAGMLARAKARGEGSAPRPNGRPAWVCGDALRLPFRPASFDAVVSTEAFHWFPDQDAALAEFFRVLSPGGRVLLGLVTPRLALVSELAALLTRLAGEPLYWPTAAELRAKVAAAGFHVERQQRIWRIPGFLLPPMLTVARRPAADGAGSPA